MKKNISYRDKLLELAHIYKISEIQNYIKRKKNLTTSQIEHILKKNKVPIPKEFNVGFFEKKILLNPFQKLVKALQIFMMIQQKVLVELFQKQEKVLREFTMELLQE